MHNSINNLDPITPSEEELTPKEVQMLRDYQYQVYRNRWENLIQTKERREKIVSALTWLTPITILLGFVYFYWSAHHPQPAPVIPNQAIAGLVDYPFLEQQVRGNATVSPQDMDRKTAFSWYKEGAYAKALEKSATLNMPFFKGMCLLQLTQYEAAIEQFDLDITRPDTKAETRYYKGMALLQLNRKAAAMEQFNLALARKDLRETWRSAAEKARNVANN